MCIVNIDNVATPDNLTGQTGRKGAMFGTSRLFAGLGLGLDSYFDLRAPPSSLSSIFQGKYDPKEFGKDAKKAIEEATKHMEVKQIIKKTNDDPKLYNLEKKSQILKQVLTFSN